jgi:heat-inducible transcriptional repressor
LLIAQGGEFVNLDERKKRILAVVVEEYIVNHKPICSSWVANLLGNCLSSATIRNEMAFLYELGLLEQPHTSAGRIPSVNGYRFYTENILRSREIDNLTREKITFLLEGHADQKTILTRVCSLLAKVTRCVVTASTPHSKTDKIQHLEVIQTAADLCVIVLATTSSKSSHKICRFNHTLPSNFVEGLNTFLNNTFSNRYLTEVTHSFVESIIATTPLTNNLFNTILAPILFTIYQICLDNCNIDIYTKGRSNLLLYSELAQNVKIILDFLEDHKKILELMTAPPGNLEIKVGQNIGSSELRPFSILNACYTVKGIGDAHIMTIGPVRVEYQIGVTYLKYFSELLPEYLKQKS